MLLRRSMFALVVLAGCPQHPPPAPPTDPPPTVGGGGSPVFDEPVRDAVRSADGTAGVADDTPGAGRGPALSAPGGGESVADTLAPRTPGPIAGRPGGCRNGADASWQVDCNTCQCGDDGQVTCTQLACGVPRGAG
ncbi:MAG: hypothetical protein H0T76_22395 [Nannocystis sp.]|nr:hypothetical protein [Nannocystis sp.]MBA3549233.1 hypothetical protein [Nannocystis sp.]